MPKLTANASPFVKIMLCGPSKSGKTSALIPLAKAGYKLRIADWDCKIPGSFLDLSLRETPFRENVDYMSFRDKYNNAGEPIGLPGQGAWNNFLRALDKWEDGSIPANWGHDTVLVLDTLNMASYGAFNSAKIMNNKLRDARLYYRAAQNAIFAMMSCLWDTSFGTNVIVTSHIKEIAIDRKINSEGQFEPVPDSPIKQYPATIGEALSREVAVFTNELYKLELQGRGPTERRVIITRSDGKMDLGTGLKLPKELDANDGLVKIFEAIAKGT